MDGEKKAWFVMRAIFQTEMKTKARLDDARIPAFVPTGYRIVLRNGRKIKVEVPIVRNLLFVYSDKKTLAPFLEENSKFQYTFCRGSRACEPLTVPDQEMERFMAAVKASAQPLYFMPTELRVATGTKIRIIGGPLDGMVGRFMKVKGARAKRLVVEIPGALAVAVEVHPDLIEVLPE